jgi:hypothetical protein
MVPYITILARSDLATYQPQEKRYWRGPFDRRGLHVYIRNMRKKVQTANQDAINRKTRVPLNAFFFSCEVGDNGFEWLDGLDGKPRLAPRRIRKGTWKFQPAPDTFAKFARLDPTPEQIGTYMQVVRHEPSSAVLLVSTQQKSSEVSRFSCMKLPSVSGVYDYAGPIKDSRIVPTRVAFRQCKSIGVLIASFRSSIPSPLYPVYASPCTSRCPTQNSGRVVPYSFLVGLFHSLLHAGLARRTASAITRQSRNARQRPAPPGKNAVPWMQASTSKAPAP